MSDNNSVNSKPPSIFRAGEAPPVTEAAAAAPTSTSSRPPKPPPPRGPPPTAPAPPAPPVPISDQDSFAAAVQQGYNSLQNADNFDAKPGVAIGGALTAVGGGATATTSANANNKKSSEGPTPNNAASIFKTNSSFSFDNGFQSQSQVPPPPQSPNQQQKQQQPSPSQQPRPQVVHGGPSLKKPSHGRTVSWGLAAASPHRTDLPSWDGASPIATGAAAAGVPPVGIVQQQPLPLRHSPKRSVVQDLNINDVINAGVHKEMEAETYILQAVEKLNVQGIHHRQTDTETDRLFSNIAENEINLQLSPMSSSSTGAGGLSAPGSPGSHHSRGSGSGNGIHNIMSSSSPAGTPGRSSVHNLSSAGSSMPVTNTSGSGTTGSTTAGGGRPAPPVKQQSTRFHGFVKKMSKGDKTVESTLFGLTSALTDLSGKSSHHSRKKSSGQQQHHRGKSSMGGDASSHSSGSKPQQQQQQQQQQPAPGHHRADSVAYDTNFSAADKLANAADKMLKGRNKKDTGGVSSISKQSGSRALGFGFGPESSENDEVMNDQSGNNSDSEHGTSSSRRRSGGRNKRSYVKGASDGAKQEWELFNSYFSTRKAKMRAYTRKIFMLIMLPSFGLAFFLFYIVENPELCPVNNGKNKTKANATMVPTILPTMAPTMWPTIAPSETQQDPWSISWGLDNNDTSPSSLINATPPDLLLNDTVPNTTAPTAAPVPAAQAFVKDVIVCPGLGASVSWWFLFLGVRQVVTFSLALVTQSFVIDYLALSSRLCLDWLGPVVTLLVVQSKGWPFILLFWAIYDLILLCGDNDFVAHWGYWQDYVLLFNAENPSGNVVNNPWNQEILINAIIVACAVAAKRVVVGLFLGRQTFVHYGENLAVVMKSMILLGELATLGREIENTEEDFRDQYSTPNLMTSTVWSPQNIEDLVNKEADEADKNVGETEAAGAADAASAWMADREKAKNATSIKSLPSMRSMESYRSTSDPEFTKSQQMEFAELLDAWEEPTTIAEQEDKKVTIGAVLQFRQALTCMKKKYPFLPAFGPADTREACIDSAQRLYERLLLRTPMREEIPFETLALVAKDEKGGIDQDKAKELIKMFRPNRDGTLGRLEFVKSIDVVYKDMRLLSANISNSSYMDAAVENLINVGFYLILVAVIIYRIGEDPVGLFLSLSSVILAFAFMFGKSASKYFDGCLFILIQRPYGVGDRMHLSNPQNDTSPDGSSGWIVESISLFTTTAYWGATNERATLCNGAISTSRVINAARSPNAVVSVPLKFGIDTEYEKIEIFRSAVEQFLKDRPREWLTFSGFRPTEVLSDKGYIGYKVIAQHRNSWQAIGGVVESKANLTTYCLEVSKQLGMRFVAPSLPVNLTMKEDNLAMPTLSSDSMDESCVSSVNSPRSASSTKDAKEALAAINLGLRNRKPGPRSKFADLVKMVVDQNKEQ